VKGEGEEGEFPKQCLPSRASD